MEFGVEFIGQLVSLLAWIDLHERRERAEVLSRVTYFRFYSLFDGACVHGYCSETFYDKKKFTMEKNV